MESLLVYLWSIWDNFWWIPAVLLSLLIAIGCVYIIVLMEYGSNADVYGVDDEKTKHYAKLKDIVWKKLKIIGIISFIVFFISSFIPNRNQMVLIMSAPYIVKVAKDSNVSELPIKLIKVLNKSLDYLNKKLGE